MEILADALLALLSAAGIWALGWMALDWMLRNGDGTQTLTLLRVKGDGDGLEMDADRLLRTRRDGSLLLVDCGLSGHGLARAQTLTERVGAVRLCRPEELENLVREADLWKKKSGNNRNCGMKTR